MDKRQQRGGDTASRIWHSNALSSWGALGGGRSLTGDTGPHQNQGKGGGSGRGRRLVREHGFCHLLIYYLFMINGNIVLVRSTVVHMSTVLSTKSHWQNTCPQGHGNQGSY